MTGQDSSSSLPPLLAQAFSLCLWAPADTADIALNTLKHVCMQSKTIKGQNYDPMKVIGASVEWFYDASPIIYDDYTNTITSTLFDPELWSSVNKSYTHWICHIVHHILIYSTNKGISYTDESIYCFKDLTLLSREVAETLFPLLIHSIVTSNNIELIKQISVHISTYMLPPICQLRESTRLVCDTIVYLQNRRLEAFQSPAYTLGGGKKKRKAPDETGGGSGSGKEARIVIPELPDPFICMLDIDRVMVCEAAVACGYYSTALYLLESHCFSAVNGDASQELGKHAKLLMTIYAGIDHDAIYSINCGNDLSLHAARYLQSGQYVEALLVYESLPGAYGQICQSLQGLGSQVVLNAFLHSVRADDLYSNSCNGQSWQQLSSSSVSQGRIAATQLGNWSITGPSDPTTGTAKPAHSTQQLSLGTNSRATSYVESLVTNLIHSTSIASTQQWQKHWSQCQSMLSQLLVSHSGEENTTNIGHLLDLSDSLLEVSHTKLYMTSLPSHKHVSEAQSKVYFNRLIGSSSQISPNSSRFKSQMHIIGQLLSSKQLRPSLVSQLSSIISVINRTLSDAEDYQLATPVLYSFRHAVETAVRTSTNLSRGDCLLLSSSWSLLEATLFKKKGSYDAAQAIVGDQVIRSIDSYLKQPIGLLTVDAEAILRPKLSNLLSQAYLVYGDLLVTSKGGSSETIIQQYLTPAITYAKDNNTRVNAMKVLSMFYFDLHRSTKSHLESREYSSLEKMRYVNYYILVCVLFTFIFQYAYP